jgi:Ribosome inactivating protein
LWPITNRQGGGAQLKLVIFVAAAGFFLLPDVAHAACDLSFQLDGKPSADADGYSTFINQGIRPLMDGAAAGDFIDLKISKSCGGTVTTVNLHMQKQNYYILAINGRMLTQSQYTYKTSDVVLSAAALEQAISDSQKINNASDQKINDLVKIFAYFFAESARFAPIEAKANGLLGSTNCGENWIDTVDLLRRWGKMSRVAIKTHATNDMIFNAGRTLAAPLTSASIDAYNQAANDASDLGRSEVDPRDYGKTISAPHAACEVVTDKRGFLSIFKYFFSKPKFADKVM